MKRLFLCNILFILFYFNNINAQSLLEQPGGIFKSTVKFQNILVGEIDIPKLEFEFAEKYIGQIGGGWRLPTIEELKNIYENREKFTDLKLDSYWSSTKGNVYYAWRLNFGDGLIYDKYNKNNTAFVRPVRTLTNFEINNSQKNGQGILTFPDGSVYEGENKDGKRNGSGTLTFSNGSKYVGEFKDDIISGQGTLTFPDGSSYIGNFKKNDALKNNFQRNGQGTLEWANGSKYIGEWKYDNMNGQGTLEYLDGSKYIGEWKDDKRSGHGTLTFLNGSKYDGEWRDNLQNGNGTYTFPSGENYVGEYKDGKMHGHGTYTLSNGEKYIGEFKYGKMHGHGTYTAPSGSKYDGEWIDDKRSGYGIYTSSNGSKYEGEWKDNRENGFGILTTKDGKKINKGIFKNGWNFKKLTTVNDSIKIGSQTWSQQNLNIEKFRNGDVIPHAQSESDWVKAGEKMQPAWCYYNNDKINGLKYGKLYNWYAVHDPRGLAPIGWHIPTDDDWSRLTTFLGGRDKAGSKLKDTASYNWTNPNTDATNESGFAAIAGGVRTYEGKFADIGEYGYWWSSTEEATSDYSVLIRGMVNRRGAVDSANGIKSSGHYVRIVFGEKVDTLELIKSFYGKGRNAYLLAKQASDKETAAIRKQSKSYNSNTNLPSGIIAGYTQQDLINLAIRAELSGETPNLDPESPFSTPEYNAWQCNKCGILSRSKKEPCCGEFGDCPKGHIRGSYSPHSFVHANTNRGYQCTRCGQESFIRNDNNGKPPDSRFGKCNGNSSHYWRAF